MFTQSLTIALLLSGTFILLLSALGVMRLPDIYCRSHALGKAMPFGINLMLIGAWIYLGHEAAQFKIFLAILFQAVSIPVSSHLLGLIAFKHNVPRWKQKPVDDERVVAK